MVERAGAVIGDLMVKVGDAWAPPTAVSQARGVQAELGWALRPEETGKGYATEAVEAALRICFQELALRRVTATCFAANTTSYRLMERVGMRREACTVMDALHPAGGWMDGYSYALLAEDWRRRHPWPTSRRRRCRRGFSGRDRGWSQRVPQAAASGRSTSEGPTSAYGSTGTGG